MTNDGRHQRALGFAILLFAVGGLATSAHAQTQTQPQQPQAQGFAVERFFPSAPGGGWFALDALDIHGGLGGAMALTVGYASKPLRVTDGTQALAVVSDQAFADFAFSVTYRRWRFYLGLNVPLVLTGQSGAVGDYLFTAPSVNLASNPDTLSDPRFGVDVRLFGGPRSRFRLGAGARLFVPSGNRADYDTDGTVRGTLDVRIAGDVGLFRYAAQLGVHIRPLDDSPTPGSPKGSELLFAAAGGVKLPVGRRGEWAVVIGPEIFGATAFQSFFGSNGTALEGLLSSRFEGTRDDQMQLRVKLGVGVGLYQHFGAPELRLVLGIETFNHNQRPCATGGP